MNSKILKQAARNWLRAVESDDEVDIDDEKSKLAEIAFMWAQQEAIDKVETKMAQENIDPSMIKIVPNVDIDKT